MARFRGTVRGGSGEASRIGHKTTGLVTNCDGGDLGANCFIQEVDGRDELTVVITHGSGYGKNKSIGTFIIDDKGEIKLKEKE